MRKTWKTLGFLGEAKPVHRMLVVSSGHALGHEVATAVVGVSTRIPYSLAAVLVTLSVADVTNVGSIPVFVACLPHVLILLAKLRFDMF